ncbi:MAG TPA: radical SAM protein [bacterium]|jgi:SynChlorMet cassette radical SAM/SPASM protein ScmF|nr:radical SAM protein [bacterium]HOX86419.1 radical SAM protein [bacterium]HPG45752.1 radical SAM protein [bacterium]HPM98021.1 radical SAM protein [bacterium]
MKEMHDLSDQLPDGVPPLTTLYLYMTTCCNLGCRHCWITPNFSKGELSAEQYIGVELLAQAIAEAKPLGLRFAKLTGGEPTLHPRFVEIADLLSEQGLWFDMETNGTLIDAKLARYLKEKTRLWFVSVSLDGANSQTHDEFRNKSGSFEAALQGIKNLVMAGFKPQVIMSPHHGNIHEVDELVDLAAELGASSVKFNPVANSGRGAQMHKNGEALDFAEILALSRKISGRLQDRTPIPLYMGIPPALCSIRQLAQNAGHRCSVRNILGILGSGEMALCGIGRNVPGLCFGRLGEDSLRKVWLTHPVLMKLRNDLSSPYPGLCDNCIHARVCQTHCVAQNFLDSGELVTPTAICRYAAEQGLFPASRQIQTANSDTYGKNEQQ